MDPIVRDSPRFSLYLVFYCICFVNILLPSGIFVLVLFPYFVPFARAARANVFAQAHFEYIVNFDE